MTSRRARGLIRWVIGLIGFALAAPAGAQPPCLDLAAEVWPGDEVTVDVTEPTWVLLSARVDVVYRLTIDGAAGTPYELWVLYVDDARVCHVADGRSHDGELIGAPLSFDWTALDVQQTGLRLEPPAGEPVQVTVRLEEVAAPPEDSVLVIPAVAHVRGVGGTLFRTDVVLFNPLGVPVTARLVLVPAATAEVELRLYSSVGDELGRRTLEVPASGRRQINDVFRFFGLDGGHSCRLTFEALPGPGGQNLFVHGSVIDNRSGDPSTLPAMRIP